MSITFELGSFPN